MIDKAVKYIRSIMNSKDRREEIIADFHTTIIRVDDNFISSSSIILDEELIGNIYSLNEVIVTGTAEISGNVTSRTSSISGRVDGDIISTEYAEIKSTAVINGHIRTAVISIERGAIINGSIRVEGNIDERDLLDKVENRLASPNLKKGPFLKYILPDDPGVTKPLKKSETRQPETATRTDVSASMKNVHPMPSQEPRGGKPDISNNWH